MPAARPARREDGRAQWMRAIVGPGISGISGGRGGMGADDGQRSCTRQTGITLTSR